MPFFVSRSLLPAPTSRRLPRTLQSLGTAATQATRSLSPPDPASWAVCEATIPLPPTPSRWSIPSDGRAHRPAVGTVTHPRFRDRGMPAHTGQDGPDRACPRASQPLSHAMISGSKGFPRSVPDEPPEGATSDRIQPTERDRPAPIRVTTSSEGIAGYVDSHGGCFGRLARKTQPAEGRSRRLERGSMRAERRSSTTVQRRTTSG